jgi:23S rRNA-/tRNA-specific pseudouridylate synthase
MGHPVTRVKLIPITGWTHQLCVHCAAMGHPILGDPAYGLYSKAHPNGGFIDDNMSALLPTCMLFEQRKAIEDAVWDDGRTMCLHARWLRLKHPMTNEMVMFKAHRH